MQGHFYLTLFVLFLRFVSAISAPVGASFHADSLIPSQPQIASRHSKHASNAGLYGSSGLPELHKTAAKLVARRLVARHLQDYRVTRRDKSTLLYADGGPLEPRVITSLIEKAVDIGERIAKFIKKEMANVQADKDARSAWTQERVRALRKEFPNHNVVICHPKHKLDAPPDVKVVQEHYEYKDTAFKALKKTKGYEIYVFPQGKTVTFELKGDGGYLNWAFDGKYIREKRKKGAFVTFS